MAPKKGGGSSSSSSSGGGSGGISCPACTEKITLWGDDWRNKKTNALFAFEIIAIIVLLACLVAATRFKWIRQAGRDRLRSIGYVIATISALVFLAFTVSHTGLSESETTTTNLYYLTHIFSSLAWRLSDLLILGVILRTIAEMSNLTRRLPALHIFYIVILSVLSATAFGIYVYQTVKIIRFGQEFAYSYYADGQNLQRVRRRVDIAFITLYFVVAIYVNVMAVFALLRDRSKAAIIFLAIVTPSLFLRFLMDLVWAGVYTAYVEDENIKYETVAALVWAENYIYTFTLMTIFGGLAVMGIMKPSTKLVQKQETYAYGSVPQQYGQNTAYGQTQQYGQPPISLAQQYGQPQPYGAPAPAHYG